MDIIFDQSQLALKVALEKITCSLMPQMSMFKKIFSKNSNTNYSGIYICGPTGCGKTMLLKQWFDSLKIEKLFMHSQDFMLSIHDQLRLYNDKNRTQKLALAYSKRFSVICIDEFEIRDIAEAMIVKNLFLMLIKNGVFIAITSNTLPVDLYKNGIQRESFLPLIEAISSLFYIHEFINDSIDYRILGTQSGQKIFYPLNTKNNETILKIINMLTNKKQLIAGYVESFGRKIMFEQTSDKLLVIEFDKICRATLSSSDYVSICKKFRVIVIKNIRCINYNETDVVIRFINLIDNIYFYDLMLFATMESPIEEIYKKGSMIKEFRRTISRIHQMS